MSNKTSTGSFFGDIIKATKAGGASSMTKSYKIKKDDTLSTIAKNNNLTLKQLMKINPKFATGQGKGSPTKATIEQKMLKPGSTIKLPDPKTFKNFRLTDVKPSAKKKDVYKKVKKKEFKEMNVPIKKKKGKK
jgi:hypothetical protein|tara:strand:- start:306 stop:704 length:399 start_codon:yes stop_codon:yes gene_type:complete